MSGLKVLSKQSDEWLVLAVKSKVLSAKSFNRGAAVKADDLMYPQSLQKLSGEIFFIAKTNQGSVLVIAGKKNHGFKGIKKTLGAINLLFCPMNALNARQLRKKFSFTHASPIAKKGVSVGLGDRLGLASPGHIRLFKKYRAYPVLAQQSVRELTLTERNYHDVYDAACWAVFQEGYKKPWGADGDHLKMTMWVKRALKIGFTMITADVSDFIRKEYATADTEHVMLAYEKISKKYRAAIEKKYLSKPVTLDCGEELRYTKDELARIVLIYKDAAHHALKLYRAGLTVTKKYDFELSVDETETPTSYLAHFFVARETIDHGVRISSLAPRFVGEFQKAIDYKGSVSGFEKSFAVHASIARYFGYRLSIHSGSDKFSVFPLIGKHTASSYHLKTAGTNWLQSLEVIARYQPDFFRELYRHACEALPAARAYYHITPNLVNVPSVENLPSDKLLHTLLQNNDVRQVLHITYGEMFKNVELKKAFYSVLNTHVEEYWVSLEKHIGKHLELLGVARA